MPKLFVRNGKEIIELSRSETQRILESKFISMQLLRNVQGGDQHVKDFIELAQRIAAKYGKAHLDANGDLKQTERQKVADQV